MRGGRLSGALPSCTVPSHAPVVGWRCACLWKYRNTESHSSVDTVPYPMRCNKDRASQRGMASPNRAESPQAIASKMRIRIEREAKSPHQCRPSPLNVVLEMEMKTNTHVFNGPVCWTSSSPRRVGMGMHWILGEQKVQSQGHNRRVLKQCPEDQRAQVWLSPASRPETPGDGPRSEDLVDQQGVQQFQPRQ